MTNKQVWLITGAGRGMVEPDGFAHDHGNVSPHTVRSYVRRIYEKMHVHSRAEEAGVTGKLQLGTAK